MSYLYQFAIILGFTISGEILHHWLPFPIPASIYGLVLLFLALLSKLIPLQKIEKVADSLITIMPILFVPALVGLVDKIEVMKPLWFVLLVVIFVSTWAVMSVTGLFVNALLRRKETHND